MWNRVLSIFLFGAAACSSTSPSEPTDAAAKFAGTWTYQPGSTIVADCAGAAEQTLDLTKAAGGQPGFFTFTAASGGLHEVDARGCQYDWSVAGDDAVAVTGQSCASFPDGRGGARLVHLASGSKSTRDGSAMVVDVHFTTDAPSSCTIHVQGTARKS